jgi:peroxiredoxin Q/BCP
MKKYGVLTILLLVLFLSSPEAQSIAELSVGDKAPDFTAASTTGEIQLSKYRGEKNVVLAFYFADFTPV